MGTRKSTLSCWFCSNICLLFHRKTSEKASSIVSFALFARMLYLSFFTESHVCGVQTNFRWCLNRNCKRIAFQHTKSSWKYSFFEYLTVSVLHTHTHRKMIKSRMMMMIIHTQPPSLPHPYLRKFTKTSRVIWR